MVGRNHPKLKQIVDNDCVAKKPHCVKLAVTAQKVTYLHSLEKLSGKEIVMQLQPKKKPDARNHGEALLSVTLETRLALSEDKVVHILHHEPHSLGDEISQLKLAYLAPSLEQIIAPPQHIPFPDSDIDETKAQAQKLAHKHTHTKLQLTRNPRT